MAIQTLFPGCARSTALLHLNGILHDRFHYRAYTGGVLGHDLLDLHMESTMFGPRSLLAVDDLAWWGEGHEVSIEYITLYYTR
jgi:hypothetical protein